LEINL
jgi:hypothetical protein